MSKIKCKIALKECLPCDGNPAAGISAETKDADSFIGIADLVAQPPLGEKFSSIACKAACFSTTSQANADSCATSNAVFCATKTWS